MTNEEQFEISEQPNPTCPMIDSVIKRANEIMRTVRGYNKANEEELRSMVDEVDTSIRYFEDKLNDIRHNVERIRTWGQEWKEEALYLSKQLEARDAPKENDE